MGKSIIDKDELKKAETSFKRARHMLMNDGDCIIDKLNGVSARLSQNDIWEGAACNVFKEKLNTEINGLLKLDKTLVALLSHCEKVDGELESYVRYIQSIFGRKF